MRLQMCPDCNWVRQNRPSKMTKICIFYLGVGINRPQNGLSRNGRVNFFLMQLNTRAIASIWRWERAAAITVSARRGSQKRALNGHFWTTKGRLAVNWDLESKKFCDEAFFQGRLPLYAKFWPSSMKKWNRPQIRFFFYHYILNISTTSTENQINSTEIFGPQNTLSCE